MKIRTPIKWYGGKSKLVPILLPLFPAHQTYVELFGGSAAMLFAKPAANVEVYNDLDREIVNFFQVLRNPASAARLRDMLELTPYARDEHADCRRTHLDATDPIERARMFYVLVRQCHNGEFSGSWRIARSRGGIGPFYNSLRLIAGACHRLRNVYIEHQDFEKVVSRFDSPQTLFYADPPYASETRVAPKVYRHEMNSVDHDRLLRVLLGAQGKVILSGYADSSYDSALSNWRRIEVRTVCHSSPPSSKHKAKRTEIVWISPAAIDVVNERAIARITSNQGVRISCGNVTANQRRAV